MGLFSRSGRENNYYGPVHNGWYIRNVEQFLRMWKHVVEEQNYNAGGFHLHFSN